MTFNIWNYNRAWPLRRSIIAQLILARRPDAVALQETRQDFRFDGGKGQGRQLAELTGYYVTSRVAHVYSWFPRVNEGVSILTREEPAQVMARRLSHVRFARDDGNRRVVLGVRLQSDETEVDVYDTHFSLNAGVRRRNALEVARFIREQSGPRPSILMGDLNAKPQTPPIRFLVGAETIDGETGDFTDVWTSAQPESAGYTYASWDPVRRIDYVLGRNLPKPHEAEVVGGEPVDGVYASDHMAVVVDVDVAR
jgi:endonuclease/exonuclease/phosphatase family metal-dependent hydrolase